MTALFYSHNSRTAMTSDTLTRFSTQLQSWIGQKLETESYPFRRVEPLSELPGSNPSTWPGLVLWINRSSLLAGAVIFFPSRCDDSFLGSAAEEAAALGLSQFVIWGARDITLWGTEDSQYQKIDRQTLPPAQKVTAEDFTFALDELLTSLKHSCVGGALLPPDLPADYFARLCCTALKDIEPGLTESTLVMAGNQETDTWVTKMAREKAWLTLWRLLLLLWHDRLPTGLSPERLDQAMDYALDGLLDGSSQHLSRAVYETPLSSDTAVLFHQLANRLRQLRWQTDLARASQMLDQLIAAAATQITLPAADFPWQVSGIVTLVNLQPPAGSTPSAIVAARSYLAGLELQILVNAGQQPCLHLEKPADLPIDGSFDEIAANLQDTEPLSPEQRDRQALKMRQAWPNQRIRLKRNTPAWIWEALYLCGQAVSAKDLHLRLPHDWQHAPGLDELWLRLQQNFQLINIGKAADDSVLLYYSRNGNGSTMTGLHRRDISCSLAPHLSMAQPVRIIGLLLTTPLPILELLTTEQLLTTTDDWPEWAQGFEKAAFLFLHSSLGQTLWETLSDQPCPDHLDTIKSAVASSSIPLPPPAILSALNVLDWQPGQPLPTAKVLDRELASLMSSLPAVETGSHADDSGQKKVRHSNPHLQEQVTAKIFIDGTPKFPEHYLMRHYRPKLERYAIPGQLKQDGVFFGRILLAGPGQVRLEVTGEETAEALILASLMGLDEIELPTEPSLTAELLAAYRHDLRKLWDRLTRECRRHIPNRQAAQSLARRIWRTQGLVPIEKLEGTP